MMRSLTVVTAAILMVATNTAFAGDTAAQGPGSARTATVSLPRIMVESTRVPVGETVEVRILDRSANPRDWLGLYHEHAAPEIFLDWRYLNGHKHTPWNVEKWAKLKIRMPETPGRYELRLYSNNGFAVRLA